MLQVPTDSPRLRVSAGGSRHPSGGRASSSLLNFKCCLVGDPGVGKTSMLMAFCLDGWQPTPGSYIPKVYEPHRPFIVPAAADGACITLTIKDTRGGGTSDETDQLRAIDCCSADCLLLCFSVVDPESYFSVETRWLPFMARTCPDAACILVGTKTDRRGQATGVAEEAASVRRSSAAEISSRMGAKLAKKIHAYQYLECSSMDKASLEAVFNTAVRTFTEESADHLTCNQPPNKDRADSASRKKCRIS